MPDEISDGALTDELAGLIENLHTPGYGPVASGVQKALEGSVDEFEDLLARHLLHEEQVLFPALREAAPEQAQSLSDLSGEHRDLRRKALELARSVKTEDRAAAWAMGREFLADLFAHVHREEAVTGRIRAGLTAAAALRFKARLAR